MIDKRLAEAIGGRVAGLAAQYPERADFIKIQDFQRTLATTQHRSWTYEYQATKEDAHQVATAVQQLVADSASLPTTKASLSPVSESELDLRKLTSSQAEKIEKSVKTCGTCYGGGRFKGYFHAITTSFID